MDRFSKVFRFLIPTTFFVITLAFFIISSTQAASLAAVYVFFNRLKAGLNGSGAQAVEIILAIDTATTIPTSGTVTIEFPDDEDGTWCRNDGALTVSTAASSAVDLSSTNWDIDSALPNDGSSLTGTCTAGTGSGSVDTITISNVGELTAGTTYGVQIAGDTGLIGTNGTTGQHLLTITASSGTTVDSKSIKIDLLTDDAVVVSATVSESPTVSCDISSYIVNIGTLYPGGAFGSGTHTISTSTTGSGYYWAVYGTGDSSTDAGLYKSTATTKLLPSGATATLDLTNASIEGFGMTLSDPDAGGDATVSTNFVDTTFGTFGTIDRLFSGAKMVLYQNGSQSSSESSTVTYGAKAGSSAPAGSYQETVYFVCGSYY
jgi:hypothetical protein